MIQTYQYKQYARRASDLVWRMLNAQLVRRVATPMPRGTKRIRLAAETIIDSDQYGKVLLLLDGMRFRINSKATVPLMDANGSQSVRDIVGSVRGIVANDRQLFGDLPFASDPTAQEYAKRWADGHIDPSLLRLDYAIDECIDVKQDESYRGYTGPFTAATKWAPLSVRFEA